MGAKSELCLFNLYEIYQIVNQKFVAKIWYKTEC